MSILRLTGVTREIGTFVILDGIDASIALGDRIGLVGPNGAGKTTLLRIAAGRAEPDTGEVHRKRGLTVGLLAQEAHFDEAFMASETLRLAVRTGAAHLDRMAEELAGFERDGRVVEPAYADLLHRYEVLGGYTLDQRVDSALTGLGFTKDEWAKPPTALSGGEQTRASLARLVIADPDLLMLDEPTNHLDLDALEWLEEHLRRRSGSLLVASHDRAFLDATVTRVWELRDRRLTAFRGDYGSYHRQRVERDARAVKDVDTQAEQIARERELIQRYRSHRKFSKMHEHEARLEKLQAERQEAPKASRKLAIPAASLAGTGPSRSGEIVIRAEGLAVGYLPGRGAMAPDGTPATTARIVARAPFLAAQRGERIGIVGPNGAGKTTLLRTIAGDLPALDGTLTFGNAVQLGYLAQLREAAIVGHDRARRPDRGLPGHPGRGARLPRPLPVPGRRRVQGGPDAVRRRALPAGTRAARDPAVEPAPARRTDEPSRHPGARGHRGVHGRVAGHAPGRVPRPAPAGDGLREAVGRGRRWGGRLRWRLQGLADGRGRRLDRRQRPRGPGRPAARHACRPRRPRRRRRRRARTGRASRPVRPTVTAAARVKRGPKLSKDAYRRQRAAVDADLTRLGLRKSHLELALGDPAVAANYVEMGRVTSELADVEQALAAAEDAWLDLEERAP